MSKRSAEHYLRCEGVSMVFGDTVALSDINMTFARGSTTVLVGSSGSGKSTLGRLLIGLDCATEGHVWFDGCDLSTASEVTLLEIQKRTAMVFQHHGLFDSFTAGENVAFPLQEHHGELSSGEVSNRVKKALADVGLTSHIDRRPSQLSGGERKRVAIARALVVEPELIVFDEPTSGLDPPTSRIVDHLVAESHRHHASTNIIITHDMATCYRLADTVHVLEQGRIIASGTPHDVAAEGHPIARRLFAASGVTEASLSKLPKA